MQHHDALGSAWTLVDMFASIGIVAGAVLVPLMVFRNLPLTGNVLISGTLFFLSCAISHLSTVAPIGYRALVVDHAVQSAAVVWFVFAFTRLLRKANLLRAKKVERLLEVAKSEAPSANVDGCRE